MGDDMTFWTVAIAILATVIVVIDYRRVAACGRRQRRHGRSPLRPVPGNLAGLIAGASGRARSIR